MRRYVPIQPASSASRENLESSESSSGNASTTKRRRIGVSIACNACRRRKIRCDGLRPNCSNCKDSPEPCIYRNDSELSHDSKLLLLEVIRLLNSIPDDETLERLRVLRREIDTSVILTILRQDVDSSQQPLDKSESSSEGGDPFQVLELSSQYPNVYPMVPHRSMETLRETTYQQLIVGGRGRHQSIPAQTEDPNPIDSVSEIYDPRLSRLNIHLWTKVPISSELAARTITLYLETDHPLLGFFEPDLFLSDLIEGKTKYCSSLLVNSLLYWASQMNIAQGSDDSSFTLQFCAEAEQLWRTQKETDCILNLIAAQFLSLGYLGQGRDHVVLSYASEASRMAVRLGLFGVQEDNPALQEISILSKESRKAYMYAAWGSFNCATYMSLFYRQPGLVPPECPPHLPVPEIQENKDSENKKTEDIDYKGGVFPQLCHFWSILHEVALLYAGNEKPSTDSRSLRFAEYKFRELLAWSNSLPNDLCRNDQNPHYVQVMHIWLHASILDIFRYGVSGPLRHSHLRTFSSPESSADRVYNASVHQLKHLVMNYRLKFSSSSYSILWHAALIYLANALLYQPKEEDWVFYFLLCVYGYERLHTHWRVTKSISTALLSLALRKGDISSTAARHILTDLDQSTTSDADPLDEAIRAGFMADLDLEGPISNSTTVENLAYDIDDNLLLEEFTNASGLE